LGRWKGNRYTIDTWGAIILSSGASAVSTTINTNGGLHVYSGAIASSTTIERDGFLGVGLGAAAYDTTVGYAGELTVWSGGVVHRNDINTWGAIILLEGAVANSTTVNEKGGLHIYWGATAYTTRVTSGASLGIGLGGRLYNSQLENNASMIFYDGSKLSGWNDFAGTVTVNGSVNASGSYISLELMTRSQEQDVIISNISGFFNVGRFSVEIDSSQTGIYKLAGGAGVDFNRDFTLYVDGKDRGKIAVGESLQYGELNYSIYKEGNTLLLGAALLPVAADNSETARLMSGILV
jgi:autotransporter passenger strand-loop-strand repeat protein